MSSIAEVFLIIIIRPYGDLSRELFGGGSDKRVEKKNPGPTPASAKSSTPLQLRYQDRPLVILIHNIF